LAGAFLAEVGAFLAGEDFAFLAGEAFGFGLGASSSETSMDSSSSALPF